MIHKDLHRISSVIHLFGTVFGAYRSQMVIITILGFLSGLFEGVGVSAIIPIFTFITGNEGLGSDFVSRSIERLFSLLHVDYTVPFLLLFIACLFILKAGVLFIANYINVKITFTYEQQIREQLFDKTLHARWEYLLYQKIGHLEKVLMDHVGNSAGAFMYASSTILMLTSLIMYIAVAVNISLTITLITLSVGGALFLVFKPLLFKTRKLSQHLVEATKQVANLINENMIGAKTVKSTSTEDEVIEKGKGFFNLLRDVRIKLSVYENCINLLIQPIGMVFILTVFLFSYSTPGFNFASFAVILYLIDKIFAYIQTAQRKLQNVNQVIPFIRSVSNYITEAERFKEHNERHEDFSFHDRLEFNNVAFAYDGSGAEVIHNISFTLHKGEMVGLVGPSGAGKTTIVDLALQLLTPKTGAITIDGRAINNIPLAQWRNNVVYVSQDIFLLNDTIAHNISFYKHITHEDMVRAAKMAQIHEFIESLPDKFKTVVGERGTLLSTGQRQRVKLAYSVLGSPAVLFLDEPGSNLDEAGHRAVVAIVALQRERGSVVLATNVKVIRPEEAPDVRFG